MSEIANVYGSIVSRLNYSSHAPGYKPGPDPVIEPRSESSMCLYHRMSLDA